MYSKIIENIYSLIGLFFSYFIKRDRSIWVFGARDGSAYCDNTRFFFEWINENESNNIKPYWITKNPNLVDIRKRDILLHNSIRAQWIIAKASLVFVSHGAADVSRFIGFKKPYVYLWHGIPIKKMDSKSTASLKCKLKKLLLPRIKTLLFLVTSHRDAKIFAQAYDIEPAAFYIGQYPRNIKLTEMADKFKNVSSSSVNKCKILFAPTFRDNNDAKYFDSVVMPDLESINKLSAFLDENDAELHFKLHPYTTTEFYFSSLPSNLKLVDKHQDILESLSTSDILITDYSSVFFDYSLLNKPIVYFLPDEDWYLNDANRGLYSDFLTSRAGESAYNWDSLITLLHKEINNPMRTRFLRDKMIGHFYTNIKDTNQRLFSECRFRELCFYDENN